MKKIIIKAKRTNKIVIIATNARMDVHFGQPKIFGARFIRAHLKSAGIRGS